MKSLTGGLAWLAVLHTRTQYGVFPIVLPMSLHSRHKSTGGMSLKFAHFEGVHPKLDPRHVLQTLIDAL